MKRLILRKKSTHIKRIVYKVVLPIYLWSIGSKSLKDLHTDIYHEGYLNALKDVKYVCWNAGDPLNGMDALNDFIKEKELKLERVK